MKEKKRSKIGCKFISE